MSKKMKKSRGFLIFYLTFIFLLSVFCIIGLSVVNDILEDYEAGRPYKITEKYIHKLEQGDYSYALAYAGFSKTDFASEKECIAILEEKYSGKELSYLESSTYLGTEKVRYNIYADGEKVGYIILEKGDATTKYGFDTWKLASADSFEFLESYTVTVPYGYLLFADGKPVGEEYVISVDTFAEYAEISGIEKPKTVTYEISGFIKEPSFTVENLNSEEYVKTESAENTVIFSRKAVNQAEIQSFLYGAMEEYIHVIALDSEMENYLQYVLADSPYAKVVKNFNKAWIMYQPETESMTLENFKMIRYAEYTETQILAEISFDYVVKMKYSSETYPSKYKVSLILTDEGWKIANMENV